MTGAEGFVGRVLLARLRARGDEVIASDRGDLDVADAARVRAAVGGSAARRRRASGRDQRSCPRPSPTAGARVPRELPRHAQRARGGRANARRARACCWCRRPRSTAQPRRALRPSTSPRRSGPRTPTRARRPPPICSAPRARRAASRCGARARGITPARAGPSASSSRASRAQLAEIEAGRRPRAPRGRRARLAARLPARRGRGGRLPRAARRRARRRAPTTSRAGAASRSARCSSACSRARALAPALVVDPARCVRPTRASGSAAKLARATGWAPRRSLDAALAELLEDWRAANPAANPVDSRLLSRAISHARRARDQREPGVPGRVRRMARREDLEARARRARARRPRARSRAGPTARAARPAASVRTSAGSSGSSSRRSRFASDQLEATGCARRRARRASRSRARGARRGRSRAAAARAPRSRAGRGRSRARARRRARAPRARARPSRSRRRARARRAAPRPAAPSIASSASRVEACPPVPKAWPGSITSSRPAKPAGAGRNDGRTSSRGEITIGSSPSFHASDHARSAIGSAAPIARAGSAQQRRSHLRCVGSARVDPERGRRAVALLEAEGARLEGLRGRALAQLRGSTLHRDARVVRATGNRGISSRARHLPKLAAWERRRFGA